MGLLASRSESGARANATRASEGALWGNNAKDLLAKPIDDTKDWCYVAPSGQEQSGTPTFGFLVAFCCPKGKSTAGIAPKGPFRPRRARKSQRAESKGVFILLCRLALRELSDKKAPPPG